MKLHSLLFSLLVFSVASADVYTVKSGDSLNKIASKHGMSVSELIKLNGIKDPNKIAIGQKLKIKGAAVSKNAKSHKVVSGDTYYRIAHKYGINVAQLKAANPGVDPSKLAIGQVLNLSVPVKQTPAPAPVPVNDPEAPEQAVIVEQETSEPVVAPTVVEEEPAAPVETIPDPTTLTKVVITEPISLADFAKLYEMTTAEVNKLNNWDYSDDTVFDTGSVAFIIKK